MPIQFTCPACGKQTVVADQFAGQSGPCGGCGKIVTIPYSSAGSVGPTSSGGSSGASTVFVILAVVGVIFLVCAGGLGFLLFGARSTVLVAQKRVHSTNNMKQILLAMHNYVDTHGEFPPAVVTDANGTPLYSGRVLLLPFLEQGQIFNQFDKSKAWDSPENMELTQQAIPTFLDPANQGRPVTRSDYVFVTGAGTLFEANKKTKFIDVTDGLSNTIAIIETKTGPDNWAAPTEWDAVNSGPPPGNHQKVQIVGYADGSVRAMTPQYLQANKQALTTKAGGEVVPPE